MHSSLRVPPMRKEGYYIAEVVYLDVCMFTI